MAQIPIREYDVKKMFARYSWTQYAWTQIRDIIDAEKLDANKKYIIKPDMLFGKRWKRWMLWINLDREEVKNWIEKWYKKEVDIDGVTGALDVFLAEEIIDIQKEYYLSFTQSREGDVITFSSHGWVDIEDNWGTTKSIVIPMSESISEGKIGSLFSLEEEKIQIWEFLSSLFHFYRIHGFTSLEFNPIALDTSWNLHLLDSVAKIDDCEYFLQKENWSKLEFPNGFWWRESEAERYIHELDTQTGASLKLKILNPHASIWTLFAGGGGSLVMTDTLWALGYTHEIWNYGELSGNPSREFTREYTRVLFGEMLEAKTSKQKYLIIAGAIANFTDIKAGFTWIVDVLEELKNKILEQNIRILVRRGGINEQAWLKLLSAACEKLNIPVCITGSESYMTDILRKIKR